MDINAAFDDLQSEVNAQPESVDTARERRNLFRSALGSEADIVEAFPSGSLARGSQIDPIHDVDLVAVFNAGDWPVWGQAGDSAEEALREIQTRVRDLLGTNGTYQAGEVRRVDVKNHSVKCFMDDPNQTDPPPFTVDVVPALNHNGHLLIPERLSQKWIESDPKLLIDQVLDRHASWSHFVPMLRALKRWNKDKDAGLKSLTIEVLALDALPTDKTRAQALSAFFTAAAARIYDPLVDPAGLCGEVQPNLDRAAAYKKLDEAASSAWRAVQAQNNDDTDAAACCWREIFGSIFPEPPGGCSSSSSGTGTGLLIGTGAAATPRKVKDSPQG